MSELYCQTLEKAKTTTKIPRDIKEKRKKELTKFLETFEQMNNDYRFKELAKINDYLYYMQMGNSFRDMNKLWKGKPIKRIGPTRIRKFMNFTLTFIPCLILLAFIRFDFFVSTILGSIRTNLFY